MSAPDTQQSPPPPPPPPSGSPFGRFLTAPVLMGAAIAILVSWVALRFIPGDGGGATAPEPSALEGVWEGPNVRLEIRRTAGTMARGRCRGRLTPGSEEGVFNYAETTDRPSCARRRTVMLSLVGDDGLRIVDDRARAPALARRVG